MNIRVKRERVSFPFILQAHGPSTCLRGAEINSRLGGGVPTFLIKNQIPGLEMDGILQLLGSALVWSRQTCGVGLEIDLHITAGRNIARFLVVAEIVSINLIKAGGVATVENNTDVVQLGAPIQLELLDVAGLDGE